MRFLSSLLPAEAEPGDYPFAPEDVAAFHAHAEGKHDDDLDEQTWRDLLLDRYSAHLGEGASIFARQELYRRLRGGSPREALTERRRRIGSLLDSGPGLDALRRRLTSLRRAESETASLLFDDTLAPPPRPSWLGQLWLLPLLLLASIALVLLVSPWGWAGTALAMYLLISLQMRYHDAIADWRRDTQALQMLLRTCSLLDGSGLPLTADFAGRGSPAGRLNRALSPSLITSHVPGAGEYGDWFMANNVKHYHRTREAVFAARAFLRECYLLCAALEADLVLARHLQAQAAWCWAEHGADAALSLARGVHPLIDAAAPLSIALNGKGAFLSGQNGVGKSTFLRMLGLNLVVARAFGFCYAQAASLPHVAVLASMQNEDSLLEGQSLYLAELARAQVLLAAASRARPALFLVDEIFRGTNHEESVSAATAVLDQLAENSLVVVSSHNLVLGTLLRQCLAPWRIVRGADGALRLEPGILERTNGVALLAQRGFDPVIQRKAESVAAWLAEQRHRQAGPIPV